jgi:tetratricopeptide (TPR) repeat protein
VQQRSAPATHLPPAPELFGRDKLLATVLDQLRVGGVVVLKGEGGMGKTTLAVAAAHKLQADSKVVWVNCERTALYEECVREAAAELFGDRCEAEAVEPLTHRVSSQLAARPVLLVLDNFETVAGDRAMVRWVAGFRAPARVLLTTREVPHGLPGRVIHVHELARPAAVQLFRARAAEAGLVTDPPAEIVDALCEQVGDQPLALELLAVRAARTPVGRLLERVRKGLAALDADGDPARPARHNGVRACFAESFAGLGPAARELLLGMSVLPSSFGTDVLAAVAGSDDWDGAADELVAASLWRLANERYATHPLVRQLAQEELGANRPNAETRAAERITNLARAKREELRASGDRPRTRAYLDWCEAEQPNLLALAHWAVAHGAGDVVIGLAQALSAFWGSRGYWNAADPLYRSAVDAAQSRSDPVAEAWCQEYLGYVCRHLGRFAEAERAYRAALALCDRFPAADAAHYARIAARYGKLCSILCRYAEAVTYLTAALDRFSQNNDDDGVTNATIYLGQAYKFFNRHDRAEELFLRGLTRARRAHNAHRESEALFQLGNTYLRMDRLADAESALHECLRLARLANDRIRGSQCLVDLGIAATRRGLWDQAEQFLITGLQMTRDLGLRMYEGRTMRRMAELFLAKGDLDRAREFARGAVALLAEGEDEWAKQRAGETLRLIEDALTKRDAAT